MRDSIGNLFNVKVLRKAVVTAFLAAIILGTLGAGSDGLAGTKEWDGFASGFDANWTTNNNWKGIGGAGPGDDLVFADKVCNVITGCFPTLKNNTTTNNFPINTSFDSILIKGQGYRIRGNQIILNNGLVFFPSSIAGVINPQATFSPNIILGESQTWEGIFGSLTLDGAINLNNHILEIDVDQRLIMNGTVNGVGQIEKRGSGTLEINNVATGFGTGLGAMKVFAGTLQVDGSLSEVAIIDGRLQGTGLVGDLEVNRQGGRATIAPGEGGTTTGVLESNGSVELNSGTTLEIDLNGLTAGTNYDQFKVRNNNISLGNANLELSLGFTPFVGQQFVIINQLGTGSVVGQFEEGFSVIENGQLFFITYQTNGVILTAQGPIGP